MLLVPCAGGCAREVGTEVPRWSRSAVEAQAKTASPERVPEGLDFRDGLPRLARAEGPLPVAVWLRARLAVPQGRDPVLLVPRAYVAFAAYVNGTRVHAIDRYEEARGTAFHVVPLPPGEDVEVLLRVVSRYTQVGLPVAPRVGERAELLAGLSSADAPRTAVGFALLTVALTALLLAISRRERALWLALATL